MPISPRHRGSPEATGSRRARRRYNGKLWTLGYRRDIADSDGSKYLDIVAISLTATKTHLRAPTTNTARHLTGLRRAYPQQRANPPQNPAVALAPRLPSVGHFGTVPTCAG